jgi:hypothetical protein
VIELGLQVLVNLGLHENVQAGVDENVQAVLNLSLQVLPDLGPLLQLCVSNPDITLLCGIGKPSCWVIRRCLLGLLSASGALPLPFCAVVDCPVVGSSGGSPNVELFESGLAKNWTGPGTDGPPGQRGSLEGPPVSGGDSVPCQSENRDGENCRNVK